MFCERAIFLSTTRAIGNIFFAVEKTLYGRDSIHSSYPSRQTAPAPYPTDPGAPFPDIAARPTALGENRPALGPFAGAPAPSRPDLGWPRGDIAAARPDMAADWADIGCGKSDVAGGKTEIAWRRSDVGWEKSDIGKNFSDP